VFTKDFQDGAFQSRETRAARWGLSFVNVNNVSGKYS